MGRHSSSRAGTITSAVIAGVILVAGGGAWAVASMLDDDGSTPKAAASATSSNSPAPDPSTPDPSDSPSATGPTASASAADAVAAAHTACVGQVAAGERVAKAAASSALHWRQHTQAQLDFAAKKIDLAQRTKIYADSKAFGLSDATSFAAATKALGATRRACADAGEAVGASAQTSSCLQRMSALDAVRAAGVPVQTQWEAHMQMMAQKQHADMGAYHQRWLKMVADAQPVLRAYDAAAASLTKAPACA